LELYFPIRISTSLRRRHAQSCARQHPNYFATAYLNGAMHQRKVSHVLWQVVVVAMKCTTWHTKVCGKAV
jgi:hypothetical protein